MNEQLIEDAFSFVVRGFDRTADENTEGARKEMKEANGRLKIAFSKEPRILSEAAKECMERFVTAELDHTTAGNRGLGRMSDDIPRFAAKHRVLVSRMPLSDLEKLRCAIARHIACGYLYGELNWELKREKGRTVTTQSLYKMWVPSIYLPPFDLTPKDEISIFIKNLFLGATFEPVYDIVHAAGESWDTSQSFGSDISILTHYFNAGMVLRLLEAYPLSEKGIAHVVTAGAYSADIARKREHAQQQGGCAVMFFIAGFVLSFLFLLTVK